MRAVRGECGGGSNSEDGGIVVEGKKRRRLRIEMDAFSSSIFPRICALSRHEDCKKLKSL